MDRMSTAFCIHPTPLGPALIAVSADGLCALEVLEDGPGAAEGALAALAEARHESPHLDADATAEVAAQLDAYFAGERRDFELALDLGAISGFVRAALEQILLVPYGETATYAEIAILAGSPGANRAVGSACARTPISIVLPAHRIVRSDGSIGEYGGRPAHKRFLLDLEARVAAQTPGAPPSE